MSKTTRLQLGDQVIRLTGDDTEFGELLIVDSYMTCIASGEEIDWVSFEHHYDIEEEFLCDCGKTHETFGCRWERATDFIKVEELEIKITELLQEEDYETIARLKKIAEANSSEDQDDDTEDDEIDDIEETD